MEIDRGDQNFTQTHRHTHTQTYTHTDTHTHTPTHTHTHRHTHTDTHTWLDREFKTASLVNVHTSVKSVYLILQPFRHFAYVTARSPTLPSRYLRHSSFSNPSVASPMSQLILQLFFRFSYVTGSSPREPPMVQNRLDPLHVPSVDDKSVDAAHAEPSRRYYEAHPFHAQ